MSALLSTSVLPDGVAAERAQSMPITTTKLSEGGGSSWTSPWWHRGGGGSSGGGGRSPGSPWWNRSAKSKASFAASSLDMSPEPRRTRSSPSPHSRSRRRQRNRRSTVAVADADAGRVGVRPPDSARSTSTIDLKAQARRLVQEAKQMALDRKELGRTKKMPTQAELKANADAHRDWIRQQREKGIVEGRFRRPNDRVPLAQRLFLQQAGWSREAETYGGGSRAAAFDESSHHHARVETRDRPGGVGASVEDIFRPPSTMVSNAGAALAARPELPAAVEAQARRAARGRRRASVG